MNELAVNARAGLQQAWADIVLFVPKLLVFAAILVAGYFVARFLCKILNRVLERVGFDRLVERGGVKRALDRSKWDASDIVSKLLFYFVMLFALQLAFGVFGPNPVSALLTGIIAYLPNVFAAVVIIIVAAAIAAGVKQIIQAAIGGLPYGRGVALGASVAIWVIGAFAALNQLHIAPAIVNGLFYAILAVFVGSAIIAVGGGGIQPMRGQWERFLNRMQAEAPRVKAQAAGAKERIQGEMEHWKEQAEHAHDEAQHHPDPEHRPRFQVPPK